LKGEPIGSNGTRGNSISGVIVAIAVGLRVGLGVGLCVAGLRVGLGEDLDISGILLRHLQSFFTSCGKYPHWSRGITPPWPAFSITPHATAGWPGYANIVSKSVTHLPGPQIEHPSSGMSGHFELEGLVGAGLGVCLRVGIGVGLCVGFGAARILL